MQDLILETQRCIVQALQEDLGDGDVTTLSTIAPDTVGNGTFVAKEAGVVAGLEIVRRTFAMLDARVHVHTRQTDGQWVTAGAVLATVDGPVRAMLGGERVALNFLQRLSGIATTTRRFVEAVRGTAAVILDTRKTAPGLRMLDKFAVTVGGGRNHRLGLYDMVLIKDNHIAAVGSITAAVTRVRAADVRGRPIEVEVKNLEELRETLALGVDRILLDNMTPDQMRAAVQMTQRRVPLEASGNVTLTTVAEIAATGVEYISVGALTHSVKALDISLLL